MTITETGTTAAIPITYIAYICDRCGGAHRLEQCPQVEAIEYYESGKIKRVVFRKPNPLGPPFEITFTHTGQ